MKLAQQLHTCNISRAWEFKWLVTAEGGVMGCLYKYFCLQAAAKARQ